MLTTVLSRCWSQAVARQDAEAFSVRFGKFVGQSQVKLDGFKARVLKATVQSSKQRRSSWAAQPTALPPIVDRRESEE